MIARVKFLIPGIEPKKVVTLLIVERFLDAYVQVIGVDNNESAGLLGEERRAFQRFLGGSHRIGMRTGARNSADTRARRKRLQSFCVYRVDDDARAVGELDQLSQTLQDLSGGVV